jgi:pristinamycin I synthase 3 and 4
VTGAYDVTGPLNLQVLELACRDVLTRHPGLTIAYSLTDGLPQTGYLLDPAHFHLDEPEAPETNAPGTVQLQPSPFAPDGFKLQVTWTPPLTPERAGRLVIAVDHIAIDGNSWPTLLRDLSRAYELRLHGANLASAEPVAEYAQFAAEQRESLTPGLLAGRLDFWRRHLDPLVPFGEEPMAGSVPPPATPRTARLAHYRFDVDIRATARKAKLTPFSLVMAVHAAVRYTRMGRSAVTTHLAADLRGPKYADSVGWYSSRLIVRHRVKVDDTISTLGRSILSSVFKAVNHVVPFAVLQEEFEPARLQDRRWRPSCFVDVRDSNDDNAFQLSGCTTSEVKDEPSATGLRDGVACWFTAVGSQTELVMQFEQEAWSDEAAATFIADLEHVFTRHQNDPNFTLLDLDARTWPTTRRPHNKVNFA